MSKRRDKNILTFLILGAIFLMLITTIMVQSQTENPTLNINSNPVSGVKFTIDGKEHVTPWSGETTVGYHTFDMEIVQNIDGIDYVFTHWVSSNFQPKSSASILPLNVNIANDTSIRIYLRAKMPDKPRKFGYITWGTEIVHAGGLPTLFANILASKFQILILADGRADGRWASSQNIAQIQQIANFCDTHGIEFWIAISHNMTNPNEAPLLDSFLSQLEGHLSLMRYFIWTEWVIWNTNYNLNRQAYLDLKSVVNAHGISFFGEWLLALAENYGTTQEEGIAWLNAQNMTYLWHNRIFESPGWPSGERKWWVPTWIDGLGIDNTCGITLGVWEDHYFISPTEIIRAIETMLTTEKAEHIIFLGNGGNNWPPLPSENIQTYASLYDRYPNVFIKGQPYTTTYPAVITTTITTVISPPTTTITTVIPPSTTTITTVDSPTTTITSVIPPTTTYKTVIPPPTTKIITTVIPTTSSSTKNHPIFIEINDIEIFLILVADVSIPILLYFLLIRRRKHE